MKITKGDKTMETFHERIANPEKVKLYDGFVSAIVRIAKNEKLSVEEVWQRWQNYTHLCYDQSAILSEFCQWNKFKVVNIN